MSFRTTVPVFVILAFLFFFFKQKTAYEIMPSLVGSEMCIRDRYLATPESIQQRAAMVLRDVHYVIDAHFDLTENAAPGDNAGKFQDIIKRRLERGQCYSMPYFGTREFPAHFRRCTELPPCPKELEGVRDLGWILLDMDYTDPRNITPRFFRASLTDGVMVVPPWNSEEVRE